jgi:hypothetical protein
MPTSRRDRDIDILLLLDECLEGERRCDERLKDAVALGHGSMISYLTDLKRQYAKTKSDLLAEINHLGASEQEILDQLSKLHIDPEFIARRGKPDIPDLDC